MEILHKQSILLDIEFELRFSIDDMIDSLLESKSYGGEKDNAPEFLTETENPNLSDLQAHLQDLFTQSDNNQVIEASFHGNIRSKLFADLIAY